MLHFKSVPQNIFKAIHCFIVIKIAHSFELFIEQQMKIAIKIMEDEDFTQA